MLTIVCLFSWRRGGLFILAHYQHTVVYSQNFAVVHCYHNLVLDCCVLVRYINIAATVHHTIVQVLYGLIFRSLLLNLHLHDLVSP